MCVGYNSILPKFKAEFSSLNCIKSNHHRKNFLHHAPSSHQKKYLHGLFNRRRENLLIKTRRHLRWQISFTYERVKRMQEKLKWQQNKSQLKTSWPAAFFEWCVLYLTVVKVWKKVKFSPLFQSYN